MPEPIDKKVAPLPAPAPSRGRYLAFGVLLLLSGAVIGSGLTIMVLDANAARAQEDPSWLTHRAATRLEHDLELTEEQSRQVHAIFEAHRERIHSLREEQHENAREFFRLLQSDIEEVLSPEQAEQWREHIQRRRERVLREGPRPGDRRGPGHGPRHDGGPGRDGRPPEGFRPDGPPPPGGFHPDGPPHPEGPPQ